MECPRCHGLMVMDTCLNRENVHKTVWIHEWRCLNCGEIADAKLWQIALLANTLSATGSLRRLPECFNHPKDTQ